MRINFVKLNAHTFYVKTTICSFI